jgi:Zn-dependent peptidase ImmA (M78 family)/transcriptional regulator with XRE-family HTH domain
MSSPFGQRLKAARVMAGLSMDGLVKRMRGRISKQAISKYENGLMMPDSSVLIALAEALDVGVDYFFSENRLVVEGINFRKRSSLGKKCMDSLLAKVNDGLERYIELESFYPDTPVFSNPFESRTISCRGDIESASFFLRQAWGAGEDAPVANVVDLLEEHGIKIMEFAEDDSFDELSGLVNDNLFIVLNANMPADRKRLTALHELAHLCLSFNPSLGESEKEKLCHSFGGAFLLPENVLERELGTKRSEISLFELASLKKQYGISMQAIMHRAVSCGIISQYSYEHFSMMVSAKGWRKVEPVSYPVPEEPQRFKQLLHRALSENLVSVSKAAYLGGMSIGELQHEQALEDALSHS